MFLFAQRDLPSQVEAGLNVLPDEEPAVEEERLGAEW